MNEKKTNVSIVTINENKLMLHFKKDSIIIKKLTKAICCLKKMHLKHNGTLKDKSINQNQTNLKKREHLKI